MPRLTPNRRWLPTLVALAAILSLLVNRGFRRLVSNTLAIKRLEQRLAGLNNEEVELNTQIEKFKKSDVVLENAARRELGYLKPGEVEYRFPPPKR
jgi:cell division protein FtsB